MRPDTIVGYTYRADTYCPTCVLAKYRAVGLLTGRFVNKYGPETDVEEVLTGLAIWRGIDREDEWTFDSDDFPKVIFADTIRRGDDYCAGCHKELWEA